MPRSARTKPSPTPSSTATGMSGVDDSSVTASTQTEATSVSSSFEKPASSPRKTPTKPHTKSIVDAKRVMRARRSSGVTSYNENALSGTLRNRTRQGRRRGDDGLGMRESDDGVKRSSRITAREQEKVNSLLREAEGEISSLLGKRGADSLEGAGPDAKKLRFSGDAKQADEKPPKPRGSKKWLKAGLYAGQEPDFDKKTKKSISEAEMLLRGKKVNGKRHALPLPMYAGDRTIERGRPFRLPFDVYAPAGDRLARPSTWRKLQSNVFCGESADIWRERYKHEVSFCQCLPERGCDDDCQNRHMLYECDSKNCALPAELCGNRHFAKLKERYRKTPRNKFDVGVDIVRYPGKGFGLRANRTFEPGQIIIEYCGEIITQEDAEDRMKEEYKDQDSYYLMLFDQNMILDATRGSAARFVNHSCEPNAKMEKWYVAGTPRMALFAGERGILSGDELTYDYNFDPFSSKNVQICHCGAPSCRGFIGRRPTGSNPKEEFVVMSSPSNKKHRIVKVKKVTTTSSANSTPSGSPIKKRKVIVTAKFRKGSLVQQRLADAVAEKTVVTVTKVIKTSRGRKIRVSAAAAESHASRRKRRSLGRKGLRRL